MRWRLTNVGRFVTNEWFALHDALVHVLRAVASKRPTLLVLDDSHMSDPRVWAVVETVARHPLPLLVVGIARGDERSDRTQNHQDLRLAGLAPTEVFELVEQIAPGARAQDVTIAAVTVGVPRHVIDAARQLGHATVGGRRLGEAELRLIAEHTCPYRASRHTR